MTWVAWHVQRAAALGEFIAVAALGIWLVATGLAMGHVTTWKYWTDGNTYVLYAVPGVLGLALGAPLVGNEMQHGTNRLAWTQGVSRTTWMMSKFLVGVVVAVLASGALVLLLQWWTGAVSLSALTNSGGFSGVRVQPATFDITGTVFVGYAVFAFALGALLGALLHRPGWAFAFGVPIFGAVRLAIQAWVRPGLIAPQFKSSLTVFSFAPVRDAWLLNEGILPAGAVTPADGRAWSTIPSRQLVACIENGKNPGSSASEAHCALLAHVHFVEEFQPASHYWALQGAETAVFLAIAGILAALTFVVVRNWRA